MFATLDELAGTAPQEEQRICIECGFCCDGTLFHHAVLQPGEKGTLPEKMELNYRTEGEKEMFLLPCPYFCRRCTIYYQKKALVCSGYRCQLLKDFAEGLIGLEDATGTVSAARALLSEINQLSMELSGASNTITFRDLLTDLKKIVLTANEKGIQDARSELFIAKCNILEALLIRHFRSAGDFEKMMASE